MFDILFSAASYLFISSFFVVTSVGVCYCLDPNKTSQVLAQQSWNASKIYIKSCDEFNKIFKKDDTGYQADLEYPEYDIIYKNLLFLDDKNNSCVTDDSNNETIERIIKLNPNPIFLEKKSKDKSMYKRIALETGNDLNNFQFEELKHKPFIQVEYIDEENTYNLHEYLQPYYLDNNHILDQKFIRFFLKFYFNTEPKEKYIIRVIDKDVNVIDLQTTDSIKLSNKIEKLYQVTNNDNIKELLADIFTDSESDGTNGSGNSPPLEF